MPKTIFFSWQGDHPQRVCRELIEDALERAIETLHQNLPVEEAERNEVRLDSDTQGVAGMPPIVDTIFRKIDAAEIFVADMTFVGARADGRPTPNPNVLIEYGWALKSLSHGRMIAVMNAAYGAPSASSMPFDMQHLRFPITYHLPADASSELRKAERNKLSTVLAESIKAILDSAPDPASPPAKAAPGFVAMEAKHGRARFRAAGERIGISDGDSTRFFQSTPNDVVLEDGPAFWLRLMPTEAQAKEWSIPEIQRAARYNSSLILPMGEGYSSWGYVRAGDGWGVNTTPFRDTQKTTAVVVAFKSGEIWTIETYAAQAMGNHIPTPEPYFIEAFEQYAQFLRRLGVTGPLAWEAGIEGIGGKALALPNGRKAGPFINDVVMKKGEVLEGLPAEQSLKPFFDEVYAECGMTRS